MFPFHIIDFLLKAESFSRENIFSVDFTYLPQLCDETKIIDMVTTGAEGIGLKMRADAPCFSVLRTKDKTIILLQKKKK